MSCEDDLEALREKLWLLPPVERCALLVLSITELDQDALAAPLNLIGVAEKMGQQLPPHCQSVLAGRHRLAAHRLEQDRAPRTTVEVNGNVRRAII